MNHPHFPNQQFRCALWVNVFHRNYSQNFFKEHLRQHCNTTNLSFHTYVGARLAKSSFAHISTPAVRSYSYLWIVFGIMALWQLPPSLQTETSAPDGGFVPGPKGSALPSEPSLLFERQPRNRHSLNWSTHSFQSWVFWGDEIASCDDKEKKKAIQLLRLLHIKKKKKTTSKSKKNAENVIRLNKRS